MKELPVIRAGAVAAGRNVPVLLALAFASTLFLIHFLPGNGHRNIISDSYAYLAMAKGETTGVPFSTRLLQPFLAASVARLTGLTHTASFQLLTVVELFLSLLVLRSVLRRRGATPPWQAALLLAFGSALAVTFAYVPVMVDPLLLLLATLTLEALDRKWLLAALSFATLAALTKEYGVLLGVIWGCHAYRAGRRRLAYSGAGVPLAALLTARMIMPLGATGGFPGWQGFVQAMFGYHLSLLDFRGAADYLKIQYMWAWSAVWPLHLVGAATVIRQLKRRLPLSGDQMSFAVALVCLPVLLLGDWGRSLLIFIPFASALGTTQPIARDRNTALLLAVAGVATALARPFHGSVKPPFGFTLLMILISVAASIALLVRVGASLRRPEVVAGSDARRFPGPGSPLIDERL